jgi:hypothetical protein
MLVASKSQTDHRPGVVRLLLHYIVQALCPETCLGVTCRLHLLMLHCLCCAAFHLYLYTAGSLFGGSTTPAFGQTPQPSLFGSSTPAAGTSLFGGSTFGAPAAPATGGLFGAAQNPAAPAAGGFGFGGAAAAAAPAAAAVAPATVGQQPYGVLQPLPTINVPEHKVCYSTCYVVYFVGIWNLVCLHNGTGCNYGRQPYGVLQPLPTIYVPEDKLRNTVCLLVKLRGTSLAGVMVLPPARSLTHSMAVV